MSLDTIREAFRDIPDFPKPGIIFKDISPVLQDGELFRDLIDLLGDPYMNDGIDCVAAIDARGFVFGAALAYKLGCGLVMIRKAGKLPGHTESTSYDLEYGSATIEIHSDAVKPGARVLLVDDVLATGGTAAAACLLLDAVAAQVVAVQFVMELGFLNGRELLPGRTVRSLIHL